MLHLKKSKIANNNEKFEKMYVKIPLKEKQFLINHIWTFQAFTLEKEQKRHFVQDKCYIIIDF